jgi:hypothetical protein
MIETEHDFDAAFHRTLLRLAGRIDDEAAAIIANWLSVGEEGLALDTLTGILHERHLPVTSEELDDLAQLTEYLGGDVHALDQLPRVNSEPDLAWSFSPGDQQLDDLDRLAIAAAKSFPGVRRLHRTYRHSQISDGATQRVFLAELDPEANALYTTAKLSDRIDRIRRKNIPIEAFNSGAVIPAYQRSAWANSLPLWSRENP